MIDWLVPIMVFLSACGEDDGEGGVPDVVLGLSGVVVFLFVLWFVVRATNKRRH